MMGTKASNFRLPTPVLTPSEIISIPLSSDRIECETYMIFIYIDFYIFKNYNIIHFFEENQSTIYLRMYLSESNFCDKLKFKPLTKL